MVYRHDYSRETESVRVDAIASFAGSCDVRITLNHDFCLGVLHSRLHDLWALRMGTHLEDRPRYTPTTCFEIFPFP